MLLVLDNVRPPLVRLIAGVANVLKELDVFPNVYITHAFDGEHKRGSLHKRYAALDIRSHNLSLEQRAHFLQLLRLKFPHPRFDVLLESRGTPNEHIHLEDNAAKDPHYEVSDVKALDFPDSP
jgi:hypothetical protein